MTIAIVGAGPAGTATALALVREGIDPRDIVLLDRAEFPRPKLCGGALSFRGTEALAELLGHPPGGAQTPALTLRCRFGTIAVRERGPQWLYDRAHLDDLLLRRCLELGITARLGEAVTGIDPTADGWAVVTGRARERYDWLIGADGARGVVRRAAGFSDGPIGRLVEAIYEGSPSAGADGLIFDFDPMFEGIGGYAWLFPYPRPGHAPAWKVGVMDGVGRVSGAALRAYTRAFAERLGLAPATEGIAGWPERYFVPGAAASRTRLLLVGEAWGIDPLLGEGIAPALHMARYAARRLAAALARRSDRVRAYATGFLAEPEGRNLALNALIARRLYGGPSLRSLHTAFSLKSLANLAGSGRHAYGRLDRIVPRIGVEYLLGKVGPASAYRSWT